MKPAEMRLELCSALLGTGLVQPLDSGVEKSAKKLTIWALCRQVPGGERAWIGVVDSLLEMGEGGAAGLHVCRRYVRKNGKLAFGWYLSLTAPAKELEAPIRGVVACLLEAKPELDDPQPRPRQAAQPAPEPRRAAHEPQEPPEGPESLPGRVPEGEPARIGAPPPGFNPNPRVVLSTVDPETGRTHIETEMPLPFVYKEMNRPNAKGRGARNYTGRSPGGR